MNREAYPPNRSYKDKMQTDLDNLQECIEDMSDNNKRPKKTRRARARGFDRTPAGGSEKKDKRDDDEEHGNETVATGP
jgi:hypothetical protein